MRLNFGLRVRCVPLQHQSSEVGRDWQNYIFPPICSLQITISMALTRLLLQYHSRPNREALTVSTLLIG